MHFFFLGAASSMTLSNKFLTLSLKADFLELPDPAQPFHSAPVCVPLPICASVSDPNSIYVFRCIFGAYYQCAFLSVALSASASLLNTGQLLTPVRAHCLQRIYIDNAMLAVQDVKGSSSDVLWLLPTPTTRLRAVTRGQVGWCCRHGGCAFRRGD